VSLGSVRARLRPRPAGKSSEWRKQRRRAAALPSASQRVPAQPTAAPPAASPALTRAGARQVLERRAALAQAVAEGRAAAADAERLLAPVAARKLRAEVEQARRRAWARVWR